MSRVTLGIIVLTRLAVQLAGAAEPKPEELTWIKDHAILFDTAEPGHGLEDLMPLKELIGDARIVALGEATHGTREFFQMKHRLVEFLASEMDFTIFSIEANMPEAYRLNDFVLTGTGDPKALIAGMYFWTWNTREVLDMVLWMREFNASGKGRIEFTGFDMQKPEVAMKIVQEFTDKVDPEYASVVADTYAVARRVSPKPSWMDFGVATGTLPVEAAAGKRVRYSGYIKTAGVSGGHAGLWWTVDGDLGVLFSDDMYDRGPVGTTEWKWYEITLDVDPRATDITFGAQLSGDGVAWFDGLQIEIGLQRYANETVFDFDFESGTARGFQTGGEGYEVTVVSDQAHSGTHSLRIRQRGEGEGSARDPRRAAEACLEVLSHLEASRKGYLSQVSKKDVEWAIQNARIVRQSYVSLTDPGYRDQSMATDVRWILDQAPKGTKMVLWAHNGHVMKDSGQLDWRPMGVHLLNKYGDDLVVLGFTCNTGSYNAIKQGRGLQANRLQPGSSGSAEYYFHKTGLPRFILDLRKASEDVPASTWLTRRIDFRSIGAAAMEQQFHLTKLPQAFDAVIYFDKTTPSQLLSQ